MVKQISYFDDEMAAESLAKLTIADGRPQPKTKKPTLMVDDGPPMSGRPSIGRTVSCALMRAVYEKRVVVGVAAAVKELLSAGKSTPECSDGDDSDESCDSSSPIDTSGRDVVFCVLAPAAPGDSASHMHTILLEAFCYENGIYIVKVDSARKLTRLLNARHTQTCALIQRPLRQFSASGGGSKKTMPHYEEAPLSVAEEALIDHCEEYWDMQQPIVQLPDWSDSGEDTPFEKNENYKNVIDSSS